MKTIKERDLIKLDDIVQYDVDILAYYLYVNYTGYSIELAHKLKDIELEDVLSSLNDDANI